MKHSAKKMRARLAAAILVAAATPVAAWSPEGHQIIGLLALEQLTPAARLSLNAIVGSDDAATIADACNWPDDYRASPEGGWSEPEHYINVHMQEPGYVPQRDCPNGACVAGAIQRYAEELGNSETGQERRWQAWARVCHFVGDIHQPLHVGYKEDRGGNDTEIVFRGQAMDLHEFWDHVLIDVHYPDWRVLVDDLSLTLGEALPADWQAAETHAWAHESHHTLRHMGYPDSTQITPEFLAQSWWRARQQLVLGGQRLARVVNTLLDPPED
jgi:hypothetical protein